MVNINMAIPEELHRKLKVDAAMQDITLKELIIRQAEHALNNKRKLAKVIR